MQMDYRLNQILSGATEQAQYRFKDRNKYVMGLYFGNISQAFKEILNTEMAAKMGGEKAYRFSEISETTDIAQVANEFLQYFREMINNAELEVVSDYYIPVIFAANQMKSELIKDNIDNLREILRRNGFNRITITYYCIFDYAKTISENLDSKLEVLRKDEKEISPLFIFTHHYLGNTDYQKYIKVVQAIAMHIHLQTSTNQEDSYNRRPGKISDGKEIYTCGYWKLDVFKQCLADLLLQEIEKQDKKYLSEDEYKKELINKIDTALKFDIDRYLDVLCMMPVRYDLIEDKLQKRIMAIRNKHRVSYKQLFDELYGTTEVFPDFMRMNGYTDTISDFENIFGQIELGNMFAINNYLMPVVQKIEQEYGETLSQRQGSVQTYDTIIEISSNFSLQDITVALKEYYWRNEAEIFQLKRKIEFVKWLKAKINSEEFKNKISERKNENIRRKNQLSAIRREATMSENKILQNAFISIDEIDEGRIPNFDDDVLNQKFMNFLQGKIGFIRERVEKWTEEQIVTIVGAFTNAIKDLKMKHMSDYYFAARFQNVDVEADSHTYERLYKAIPKAVAVEVNDSVHSILPFTSVQEREWQTRMCFELFAIYRIEDLHSIYNMK